MKYYPGFEVVSRCIPDQPEGIHDYETEQTAVPKVLALAREMEREGMEAVIVSCAGDPAVAEASAELRIPVIGAGRSAASAALVLARPTAVLGITQEVPVAIRSILGDLLVSDAVPDGVESTLDLMEPEGKEAMIKAGVSLAEKGARAIVLACTGMSTIGAADTLKERLDIPVIDPVKAQAAAAWTLLV
ncbi:MAG: hydantoin racemase [Synergistaceae bacterium]|nr:hydantoin racemase [Synergistaceae bacterium]